MKMRIVWVLLSVLLLGFSVAVAAKEFEARAMRPVTEGARFDKAQNGVLEAPVSFEQQQQVLLDCMEMADGVYGLLQFDAARRKMALTCDRYARQLMVSNPNYGFAALVRARMATVREDWQTFNSQLALSQHGAPSEQWVSVERLRLYTRFQDKLNEKTTAARSEDISLLLSSPAGIKSIASLYLQSEDLRNLIAVQAEQLPERVQRRFVSILKRVLQN